MWTGGRPLNVAWSIDGKVDVGDVLATLCAALGVPPDTENVSEQSRPIKIAEGEPIKALLT